MQTRKSPRLVKHEKSCFNSTHGSGQWAVKVEGLDRTAVLAAAAEKVGEVLHRELTFLLDLGDFLLASAKIFDVLGQARLQISSREAENASNLSGDAVGI